MPEIQERLKASLPDHYRIEREVGRGGMATVFLAQDLKHQRPVAIKVLHREVDATDTDRFRREIEIIAGLTHPHILPLHDSGVAHGLPYFVMPFVAGETLRARLDREKQLPLEDVVRLTREIGDALDHAHAQGIVHRDVKPENILLVAGHAVISDFGIARVTGAENAAFTQTGTLLGTPAYMSPEQAAGSVVVDGRSDVYSLACVVYETLAGQPPFTAPRPEVVLHQHLNAAPRVVSDYRPGLSGRLDAVVSKGLAKSPADRPPHAGAFARDLASAAEPRAAGEPEAKVGKLLLAVLPFENLSGDPEQEYFSDGMTEEMTAQLGRLNPKRLGVIARTSAMRYKRTDKGADQIGRELGAAFLLEGSVRRSGGRLRITAQLVQVEDQTHMWADSFDRDASDVFGVQTEVAGEIARALAVELMPAPRGSAPLRPVNPEAHEEYLRGRYHFSRRSRDGVRKALALFEKAVAIDPDYAMAHVGVAVSLCIMAGHAQVRGLDVYQRAQAAALRALALDDASPQAHAAMGLVSVQVTRDWPMAEAEYRRAMELDPSYAEARFWYAIHRMLRGRVDEGIREARKSLELDPLSLIAHTWLGWMLFCQGELSLARHQLERTLDMDPGFVRTYMVLGWVYESQGAFDAALEQYASLASEGEHQLATLFSAHCLAVSGRTDEARKRLDEALALQGTEYVQPAMVAAVHEALNDRPQAMKCLEQAHRDLSFWVQLMHVHPWFRDLRSDAHYAAWARSIGLPDLAVRDEPR